MSQNIQKVGIIASLVIVFGGLLTFIMTWINIGSSDNFTAAWLSSFALCVLCIAPIGGVIAFFVHRLVNAMFSHFSYIKQNLIFGFIMATVMESIMAIVTTINLRGFIALEKFISFWFSTFVCALPAGLVISVLMSLVIKPKLSAFWAKQA